MSHVKSRAIKDQITNYGTVKPRFNKYSYTLQGINICPVLKIPRVSTIGFIVKLRHE